MTNSSKRISVCAGLVTLAALNGAPAPQQGYARVNGITIAYESFGSPDRETVLLIAGTGMQLTGWPVQFCQELVKWGYRVVRYGNRDIGLSTKFDVEGKPDFAAVVQAAMTGKPAPLPYTLYDLAKDAVGLLDALTIQKAHIAGARWGHDRPDRGNQLSRANTITHVDDGDGRKAWAAHYREARTDGEDPAAWSGRRQESVHRASGQVVAGDRKSGLSDR
jgi:hypothetical protein